MMSKALIFFSIFFLAVLVESRPLSNGDVPCAGCDSEENIFRPKRQIEVPNSKSNLNCNGPGNRMGTNHGCASATNKGTTNIYYIGNGENNQNIVQINRPPAKPVKRRRRVRIRHRRVVRRFRPRPLLK